ncbi:helix-turn-helix transcriptional regulator [Fictibacillus phosphorivorans]|uniref:helix-turn-helix transcriptional regulator n=1 Tax=Fictibacillus phosphorivorans TaxID=1221500 RepID=UPI0020426906|nr:WYL domain-containing protein [Fictibacillus phosphorivorans]MCM3718568.1 WYL domain-containing protein [Fictibacillus phosphorivorans]MCM3776191.1 WYL domain-containing protein [Fictibacillus phosphorivorans]
MAKIKRLERLLLSINTKKHFTLKELAVEFQVSTRTIQRDLLRLMEMGLPIVSEFGPHGGYRIEDDRILPPIGFTEMEASSILFALHAYEAESFPYQVQSRSASTKLLHYLPADAKEKWRHVQKRLAVHFPLPKESLHAPVMLEAAMKQKIVTVLYHVEGSNIYSNIQPIGIYNEDREWFCPAYCYSLNDFHVFNLSDIHQAVINYEPMDTKDFTAITIHNWAAKITPRSYLELVAEIAPHKTDYCVSHPFLKQFIVKVDDGTIMLKGRVLLNHINKIADYLWFLKSDITIHSPHEIKMIHARWAKEISAKNEVIFNM